jgi:hypothetical protein
MDEAPFFDYSAPISVGCEPTAFSPMAKAMPRHAFERATSRFAAKHE